jgi:peptidyl-prolyl cis-trans isomerase D
LGDNFVIAFLTDVTEEGIAPFEDVSARVELNVIKEKKTEKLIADAKAAMEGKSDLESIASALNTTVENATGVNFESFQVPGIGIEPAVIGAATSLEVDQISEPVAGNNGVFILKVTSISEGNDQDLNAEKIRLAQNYNFRATSQAVQAHRDVVEIVDKRSKFY